MPRAAKPAWTFALLAALAGGAVTALAQQGVATKRLTPKNEYTGQIEGPAVDPSGNLYVVNFGKAGTIGRIKAGTATSELFATLPVLPPAKGKPAEQSKGSGIRFDRQGRMYVAAFNTHKIFVFEPGDATPGSISMQHSISRTILRLRRMERSMPATPSGRVRRGKFGASRAMQTAKSPARS